MPSSMCLRCLTRSLLPTESTLPSSTSLNAAQRAAFSTSSSLSAQPVKKKGVVAKPSARTGRTLRLSKNKRAATGKPPAPGERKAVRKRVVLSNTNALEVAGLQDLNEVTAKPEELEQLRGKMLGFTNDAVDAMRALEGFKPTQGWSLFRRPATVVRGDTVRLGRGIEEAMDNKAVVREVLFGAGGSGKSVLQLQAMAMAAAKGWLVMHFAEGKDLTNAHTAYQPISTPDGTQYIQPAYTATMLGNLLKANQKLLSTMRLSKQHQLPVPVQSNISLSRFAEIGAKDTELAWPIWQALFAELTAPSQEGEGLQRPPVFVGMDGVDHVMRDSAYLNSEAQPIHAHDLTLVRSFTDLLSGKAALPNGGMVLASTSESNRASAPTLDFFLDRNYRRQKMPEASLPEWDPYTHIDQPVADVMESVTARKIRGLSKFEARGVMEYYAQSGMLRSAVTDSLVNEKWTLAGGGIVGQIEKGSVMLRF